MVYYFEIIQPSHDIWRLIEQSEDSTCFHTEKWNNYIQRIGAVCQVIVYTFVSGDRLHFRPFKL